MQRAIVHVGMPRTGTTTLQRVLSERRADLLQAGILYPLLTPRSAPGNHLSHQYLGEVLDGRRPRRERTELLRDLAVQLDATDADLVLLSYESLCLISPRLGVPGLLAAILARHGFAMEVLATVRPPFEYLNSTYTWRTQFLLEHRIFPDYFRADVGNRQLDLARLLEPWRSACAGRISVVPMRDPRSDRPFVERIIAELGLLNRVGASVTQGDLARVENRSPGPVTVEAARILCRGGAQIALGRAARDATRFIEEEAQARGLDAMPFRGLDAGLRAEATDRWEQANDRFARQIWGTTWSARVAPGPALPANEIARSETAENARSQAQELVRAAMLRFDIRLRARPVAAVLSVFANAPARLGRALRHGRTLTGAAVPKDEIQIFERH